MRLHKWWRQQDSLFFRSKSSGSPNPETRAPNPESV
jgi:hypothetical protein